jgi:tetratricopeptide (TPR) repeat protein
MQNKSLNNIDRDNMAFPYLERSLSILNPWVINLDSGSSNGIDSLSKDQVNKLLDELIYTEQNMAKVTGNRRQFDVMEGHCQRCLVYSRRYELEGEKKTTMIFDALRAYVTLRQQQDNLSDALTFAEKCYNLVVEAYDPVHPQVQEAAGILIHILISKGDLYDAERYAQVTYGNLRDKKNGINQESEAVAKGAYNLADVIFKQGGDLIKAEELARESLRIRSLIDDSNHQRVGFSCSLLANILRVQSKLGDETRGLFENSLAISTQNQGPDGESTAVANSNLGLFHRQLVHEQATFELKLTQLLLAQSHFEEALQIYSKIHGPTHPETVATASRLASVTSVLS